MSCPVLQTMATYISMVFCIHAVFISQATIRLYTDLCALHWNPRPWWCLCLYCIREPSMSSCSCVSQVSVEVHGLCCHKGSCRCLWTALQPEDIFISMFPVPAVISLGWTWANDDFHDFGYLWGPCHICGPTTSIYLACDMCCHQKPRAMICASTDCKLGSYFSRVSMTEESHLRMRDREGFCDNPPPPRKVTA